MQGFHSWPPQDPIPPLSQLSRQLLYTDTVLVGVPDVSVFQTDTDPRPTASTQVLSQPMQVNAPMSEEVQERYLEIRQAGTGRVVTVIELLSPKNKRAGVGRGTRL